MNTTYIKKTDILKWYIYKILLIMRLTTVILMVSMLQVSASTVAQEFNYVKKGVSLIQIFKEIKKQTGYNIIWNEKKIDVTTTIDADFKKATIHDVLNKCLKNLPLSYSINDKMVMIKENEPSFRDKVVSFFTAIDVRGRVVGENNQPLAGATVQVKNSIRNTRTDDNGFFTLHNIDEESVLVISYMGYDTKEIKASDKLGSIQLVLSTDRLKEVEINAGYYTVTDRERTGNISRVTAEEIGRQPVNNPLMALVGNVPGLQVTQSSGVPGGGFTVRVRGQNSLLSGNDPLYIVNGVIYPSTGISSTSGGINTLLGTGGANPLGLINPNDIESIEILKDADATAIYGSRGANGVILITTKKGKQGLTKVEASVSQGFSQVGHKVDLLNTEEYLQMRREAYFTNDKLNTSSPGYTTQYDIKGTWDENKYTDWQEELIGGTALLTNASLNLSGGSTKSNYLISANYNSEGTVVPGDFGAKRFGVTSNINLGGTEDRFHTSLTLMLNRNTSDLYSNLLMDYIFSPPNQPDPYDQDGQLNWASNTVINNPFANMLNITNSKTDNAILNLTLSYRILKNLNFKTSLGYNSIKRQEFRKLPLASFSPSFGLGSSIRSSYFGNNYNNNFSAEQQLKYQTDIGKGKIDALIGSTIQSNYALINVIQASNFISDDLMENLGSAATLTRNQNNLVQYRYFAVFARLNYSLANKYFLNLTGRRDGSSRFGPGKQFANFGAVGAGWIFSEERTIKDALPFLSFGKLRGSYGITGNDQISDYAYLQLWNANTNYQGNSTLAPSASAANALFAWESNRKLEAAVQLGFFKEKTNLEVSWFKNRSSNQLMFELFPLSAGQGGAYRNLPAEIENKGWEFQSNISIVTRTDWKWKAGLNVTIPKNRLLAYPNLESSPSNINYKVGEPLNILKVYNVSVDQQSGSYVVEDKNGNGTIENGDRYIVKFLGQSCYGGLQNSITFKQFNLDFLLSFAKQNGKSFQSTSVSPGSYSSGVFSNQFSEVLNRWQAPGDIRSIAKFSTTSANNSLYSNVSRFGNAFIVDASYIRLRNVALTYSLPKTLLSRLKINNASISLQGQNLYTITNYIGFDPETQGVSLPPLRTVMLGLNITF